MCFIFRYIFCNPQKHIISYFAAQIWESKILQKWAYKKSFDCIEYF